MTRMKLLIGCAFVAYLAIYAAEKVVTGEGFPLVTLLTDLAEMALIAVAVWMTAVLATDTRLIRIEREGLLRDLAQARADGEVWRTAADAHMTGLSRAIARQFADWGLTEAEADVAALMLKGLSHKEIAHLRAGSEATVRQHAAAVYRKSGLVSRTQLTAYFLEDLLAPTTPRGPQDRRLDA